MQENSQQQHVMAAPMMMYNPYSALAASGGAAPWGPMSASFPHATAFPQSMPPSAPAAATLSSGGLTHQVDSIIADPIIAKTKFPPNFEVYGAAYVFQAASGMFLDQVTEFYYCPKSKLYYNSKDGVYYKYILNVPGRSNVCPFVRFNPPLPSAEVFVATSSSTNDSSLATTSSISAAGSGNTMNATDVASLVRQPVIISLGGNSLKNKLSINTSSANTAAAAMNKKVINNFMKWESANSSDDRDEAKANTTSEIVTAAATSEVSAFAKAAPKSVQALASNAAFTAAGIPVLPSVAVAVAIDSATTAVAAIPHVVSAVPSAAAVGAVCLLCRRQFASGIFN